MASEKRTDATDLGVESNQDLRHLENVGIHDKGLNASAIEATAQEHSIGFVQGFKTYRKAAMWSFLISMTVIMEGYDVTLLGSFYGYPTFREKYGKVYNEENGYQISSVWQQRFNCMAAVGNIVGALLNGWATARWGHRKVLIGSLAWLSAFVFVVFFAPNIEILLVGQTLCNVPWGVFATTGPSYAAEVTPLAIRGYMTSYINLCWVIGQFISALVLNSLVDNPTRWGYKIPFALQWMWPVPLALAAFFAPESPWFLVRQGRLEEAKHSLKRLSEPEHNINYDNAVALMVHTNMIEIEETAGANIWDTLRGTNLRRTEVACMSFLSHITNGGALCYSGSFFFQQTGIAANTSYAITLGGKGLAFVCTVISWAFIHKIGRRRIWLYGFGTLACILWTVGFLALAPNQTLPLAWAQSILCVVWLGVYSASVGPIVYTIVAEIGSSRLRTQTIVIARSVYYVGNIICGGVINPKMMAPDDWNLKGKAALFWSSLATITFIWGYFRLPETKDRTFGEMDIMFHNHVPARKTAKYEIPEDDFNRTGDADPVIGDEKTTTL
ncbi:Maltose permease-like protein [Emericellopsis cladophorae]|uniref:Maltose permease-like protein n=1 Tax=Emericellopsis cladophorae TaxID=2686198 RepID=A0A9P9Y256_9HYPO|nr:Maltose permease-like protein [Emericellopsis cladophorae]KAI6781951.1 Maltose permease-like protein [Emericellopsis cladophorae]